MAIKNSNIILYRNSVALDKGLRLVKSREKEKALEESDQIPYGGIMVIVRYGSTRYVKITDGAKTFSEIPKDGEGGSGGGDASTLNGQNGAYYRNRANHTGTQPANTITGLGTAALADTGDFATSAQGAKADSAVQPSDITNVVESNQEGGVGILINNIIQVTQAQYDGLTPQGGTFYAIVG